MVDNDSDEIIKKDSEKPKDYRGDKKIWLSIGIVTLLIFSYILAGGQINMYFKNRAANKWFNLASQESNYNIVNKLEVSADFVPFDINGWGFNDKQLKPLLLKEIKSREHGENKYISISKTIGSYKEKIFFIAVVSTGFETTKVTNKYNIDLWGKAGMERSDYWSYASFADDAFKEKPFNIIKQVKPTWINADNNPQDWIVSEPFKSKASGIKFGQVTVTISNLKLNIKASFVADFISDFDIPKGHEYNVNHWKFLEPRKEA